MTMGLDLREQLSQQTNIPRLSLGSSRLMNALMDDERGLHELEGLLEEQPGIAARLVGLANSAWSAPQGEITSLQMACTRLGLNVVRSVAIALMISSPFDAARCQRFEIAKFWATGLLLARTSVSLAAFYDIDPATARTAGLLRQLGLLWLADAVPELVDDALASVEQNPETTLSAELAKRGGIGYLEATALLLKTWNLPAQLVSAMVVPLRESPVLSCLLLNASELTKDLYADADLSVTSAVVKSTDLAETYEALRCEVNSTKALAKSMFP